MTAAPRRPPLPRLPGPPTARQVILAQQAGRGCAPTAPPVTSSCARPPACCQGRAGWPLLRTGLGGLAGSVSLPLDIGAAAETIPVHLRRAVTVRDPQCRFPGCDQPAVRCQPHHIIPRAQGGPTSLANLINLCSFHHLVAVHRRGWGIALHPDGIVTATSPEGCRPAGQRTLRSHSPPATAA